MTAVAASVPVLRWAAHRARLNDEALAARFPKWPLWLSGDAQPTLKQLEDFARMTHTAFGYFFLPQPPALALPVPDFRTLRDEVLAEPSSDLLDTLYLCQQRQDWYRDHARMHGLPALTFVGSASLQEAPEVVAQRLRETLGLSIEARRQLPTWTDELRQLIAKAEDAGVMVMVSSVVGSNSHRKLDVGEFRGFALADDLAPLVFLNGADSKAAQMFTLAHELAHVWLGATGVSDSEVGQVPEQQTERWCNQVAAQLLMPLAELRASYQRMGNQVEVGGLQKGVDSRRRVVLPSGPCADLGELRRQCRRRAAEERLAVVSGPVRQFVLTGFDFIGDLVDAEHRARIAPVQQPVPKRRAEIKAVVQVLGGYEDVSIQQIAHCVTPSSRAASKNVAVLRMPSMRKASGNEVKPSKVLATRARAKRLLVRAPNDR